MIQQTELDHPGRIVAIRLDGSIVKNATTAPPPDPDYVEAEESRISYDVRALLPTETIGLVNLTNKKPAGRVCVGMDIRSARLRDRCSISLCNGDARIYVGESLLADDPCPPPGP